MPRAWLSASYTVGSGNTAAVVDRSHPYLRSELARKLMNNVTTVSSVFTVTFTVVFHEVRTRGHDPLILVGPFVGDGPRPEHEPRGILVSVDHLPASKDLVADGLAWAGRVGEPILHGLVKSYIRAANIYFYVCNQ